MNPTGILAEQKQRLEGKLMLGVFEKSRILAWVR